MKITKIHIKDFRAFRGEYTIDLKNGRNLLLYGENGSGKSSLFQALNLFFAPATPFADHKNIFVTTADGYVKLEIGDGLNPSNLYEWEETTHPFSAQLIDETSKTKGFLDYRALLETHFVHRQADSVNVFELFVNTLLANTQNPITKTLLANEWKTLQKFAKGKNSPAQRERLNGLLKDFNAGLVNVLGALTTNANQILTLFDQNVVINLALHEKGLVFKSRSKEIDNQVVMLTAKYYNQPLIRHHHFLNEARLSSIAISIYLGALLLNPPSKLLVLFLDDLLIGLDMCNRLPMLEVLEKFFADWQIILATFDRVWFEMAWQRVEDTKGWERGELFFIKTGEGDVPVYEHDKQYLSVAKKHLAANDLKAAAVYIRSAYEHSIKRFCDRNGLLVRYCENPKDQKSDDFWQAAKSQKRKDGSDVIPATLVNEIELHRASILNQLSHTAPVNLVRKEVEESYQAVETLQSELQKIKRGDLH